MTLLRQARRTIFAAVCVGTFSACPNGATSQGAGGSGSSTGTSAPGSESSSSAAASTAGSSGASTASSGGGAPDSGSASSAPADARAGCAAPSTYDETILCDDPVGYWAMSEAPATEADLTGSGHPGTYMGGTPAGALLPNGDSAADFNGSSEYLTIPSIAGFSIPTTGNLTWEGWIRPDVLQFPNSSGGYVDWMGKCDQYAPTCEWEARFYTLTNSADRPSRLSAYVFNPAAGLGSGADWQPDASVIQAAAWYHVVGEYTVQSQPSSCPTDCSGNGCTNPEASYPGAINIWVNGVEWNQASHSPTGCMCQYCVVPVANSSAINIGTMALDTWFQGAVGKVAIYGYLLSSAQIAAHYAKMTGVAPPAGSCADTCSL